MNIRFQFGLACILLVFCGVAALITYFLERDFYIQEASQKAELVMAAVDASRQYIRTVLRPRMYEVMGQDEFVIEAMSTSYATRVIMENFRQSLPEFLYRRVAINARNPDFEANAFERRMIEFFKKNPKENHWFDLVKQDDGVHFMQVRPVRFSRDCLHCHGNPASAPREILDLYGDQNGFFKKEGEIAGVQSIAIPAEGQMAAMRRSAFQVFSLISLVILFLYAVIWIFFDLVVARKVRSVLSLFRENLEEDDPALHHLAHDSRELSDLTRAAEMMAASLSDSRRKLERYNRELESMVAQRTRALEESKDRLHRQVEDRNAELSLLNTIAELITRAVELQDILPAVLDAVLELIPARGAGIYLLDEAHHRLRLSYQKNAPELEAELAFARSRDLEAIPGDLVAFQLCGQIELTRLEQMEDGIRVPLCCRNTLQGIMIFTSLGITDLNDSLHALLLSVGRQIGITLESLRGIRRLHHSRELLRTVFDAITDPLVLLDGNGSVQMVNQAFLDYTGCEPDGVCGCRIEDVASKDPLPLSQCFREADLSALPLRKKCHDRGGKVFEVMIYPVRTTGQKTTSYVCFARDVTEEQLIEARIQQAERLASMGQLAAGVAHEINNPLGVILCYTDLLGKQALSPQAQEDIAVIERQARSCQRIVGDLLNFARSHTSSRAEVNINELVREVTPIFTTQMRHQGIDLRLMLAGDLPVCRVDREQIKQVLVNLIINAIQAIGEEGGVITVSTGRAGEHEIRISVEDTGTGIRARDLAHIFDPFFTTKGKEKGTGLGLSLSYSIVREHGGTIEVQSETGKGSLFTICLPVGE